MKYTREFYIPKFADRHENVALSAIWYTTEIGGKFWLTAFGGKRTKPDLYCTYRSEAERCRSIQRWIDKLKARQERKAQAKANRTGLAEPAKSAKILKGYLQEFFPGVKFSVTSCTFSGGDAIDIDYTDGPLEDEVASIANLFQCGNFDGMTDTYNYRAVKAGCKGAKYVHVHRERSQDVKNELIPILREKHVPRHGTGDKIEEYAPSWVNDAERIYRGATKDDMDRRTQERIELILAMASLKI